MLSGPAGVGKTSIAVHALKEMSESDASVRVVHFAATTATQSSPLAVFMAVLRDNERFASESPDRVAKAIIAACAELPSDGRSKRASPAQLVIMIDDAPLLDNMSALVVDYLIARTDVRIILTCRSTAGLGASLTRAWRDGILEKLEIPVLSVAEVAEIAGEMLAPTALAPDSLTRLARVSGGNALFLTELVHSLVRSDALEFVQGLWVWRRPVSADTSLSDIVGAELEQLSLQQRTAFETLALSAPVSLRIISAHLDLDTIGGLAEQRLVTLDERDAPEPMVALAHPIYGDVIAAQLNKAQLMAHYRALFESVFADVAAVPVPREAGTVGELRDLEPSVLLPLVQWGLNGGCVVPLELLRRAYEVVHVQADYEYRIRLASAILQHPASDAVLRITALNNRIEAYRFSNNPLGVASDAELARSILERMPPSAERAHQAVDHGLAVAEALVLQQGHWQEGLDMLEWAEQMAQNEGSDGALVSRINVARGIYLGFGGRMRESVELQRELYARMHSSPDFLPLASTLVISLAQRGELQRTRTVARQQMGLAVRSIKRHPLAISDLVGAWCLADLISGNVREATIIFALLNAAIEKNPGRVRVRQTLIAFGRGLVATSNGEWEAAVVQLKVACSELEDFTGTGSEGLLLSSLALAQAATGDHVGSAENRERFFAQQGESSMLLDLPARYNLLLASLYAPRGGEAVEARALASRARHMGFALIELRAIHALAMCSRGRIEDTDMNRARELAEQIGSPLSKLLLKSCEHIDGGGDRSVDTAARGLARRGLFIPAQRMSSELTEREEQLAHLLALGYSNSQIASRLFISKRTVESHAAKVLQKLRVSSRDDVAEALEAREQ